MNYLERAFELSSDFDSIRKDLHRHPELGNHEFWTRDYIQSYLNDLGLEVSRFLDTAIVARLRGNDNGPTVAVRADIDALPVVENTGCDFSSENSGIMHACGHDIHMASALLCAKLLSENRNTLKGDVLFLFQPDEEGSGGARRLIEAGALDNVSAVFGGHVAPDLPLGTVGVRYGKFYAASDVFMVKVRGVSCHGATPEKGTNSLLAASEMVTELGKLKASTEDRFVLSVCQFRSGNACNVISPEAEFGGILRTLGPVNRVEMKSRIKDAINDIASRYGVSVDINIRESYGGIVNTDNETSLVERSAREVVGFDNVIILDQPTMTTEDFGYYTEKCTGSFCHFGCGCELPLHSDRFLPDFRTVLYAGALYAQTVTNYLS